MRRGGERKDGEALRVVDNRRGYQQAILNVMNGSQLIDRKMEG
jgi:hypothetical protein